VRFQRTRYIPKNSTPIEHPQGLGIAYFYTFEGVSGTRYGVVAYGGKRTSADFHYSFKTIGAANDKIESWFDSLRQHVELVKKYRAQRYEGHDFKIGDVITNSWGYDQTNVDFYRIVKASAHFVWLQPIAGAMREDDGAGPMSGYCRPDADVSNPDPSKWGFRDLTEPVEKHAASKGRVSMKYGSGSKWDGRPLYTSWYA
jgi:hypothetical protein